MTIGVVVLVLLFIACSYLFLRRPVRRPLTADESVERWITSPMSARILAMEHALLGTLDDPSWEAAHKAECGVCQAPKRLSEPERLAAVVKRVEKRERPTARSTVGAVRRQMADLDIGDEVAFETAAHRHPVRYEWADGSAFDVDVTTGPEPVFDSELKGTFYPSHAFLSQSDMRVRWVG